MRAPFVALVYPYRKLSEGDFEYALFRRADLGIWQAVSGGGEDDESPEQAARREVFEETGLAGELDFLRLDTVNSIPVTHFSISHIWGEKVYVIPQYCFGVAVPAGKKLVLSHEHTEMCWLQYPEAYEKTHFDDNKVALWELNLKLLGLGPRGLSLEAGVD